ncbi:DUF1178 family protein [Defluviimonas salinarum]|uniref:DUF1178 family protein n=1 Tax=Defluviimonas salinarum TaxID=2992147 RepID=A0ABT3J002_9RHOB|nr:DUF1178 family protein [Defluviimonas salinarum]MCW3780998.1 DUF1178 family protein [Defluviimonas salinarum]
MIRYALSCADDHSFESWFQSAEAFDRLLGAGMISCTVCGSTSVTKTLMAPAVRPARKAAAVEAPLSKPASKAEEALAAMRRQIEQNSDYVGLNFAAEARAMHEGEAPERSIYGEARVEDAKRLIEDGIPVAPLPFMPARKTN